MPIHDWTRVSDGTFHHFRHGWIDEIAEALNAGLLPRSYYAMAEQSAAGFGPDVLTLQAPEADGGSDAAGNGSPYQVSLGEGGVALAKVELRPTAETDLAFYRRKQNVVAVRDAAGDRVVAVVEIVSRGNKSAREPLDAFVKKVAALLEKGIHLLIIDLRPPGRRDPAGIHNEIWQAIAGEDYVPPILERKQPCGMHRILVPRIVIRAKSQMLLSASKIQWNQVGRAKANRRTNMATQQRKVNVACAFRFDYRKAAEATACLLRREKNRQMHFYRLLKLLYVADRESIREIGRPIVGGGYVVTDRGPMHSAMLELIEGSDAESPHWLTMFRRERYEIEMIRDAGSGNLSKHEIETLNRVAIQYQDKDDFEVREITRGFQEVASDSAVRGPADRIPLEEIVNAVGRDQDLDAILRDAKEKAVFDRIFGE